jgi:hypothetical protein
MNRVLAKEFAGVVLVGALWLSFPVAQALDYHASFEKLADSVFIGADTLGVTLEKVGERAAAGLDAGVDAQMTVTEQKAVVSSARSVQRAIQQAVDFSHSMLEVSASRDVCVQHIIEVEQQLTDNNAVLAAFAKLNVAGKDNAKAYDALAMDFLSFPLAASKAVTGMLSSCALIEG